MCREFQGSAVTSAYLAHCGPRGQRLSVAGEGELCSNNPGIPGWEEEEEVCRGRERSWNTTISGTGRRGVMGD